MSRLGGLEISPETSIKSPIVNAQGKNILTEVPQKSPSLLEANLVKGSLYDQGNKLKQSISPGDHSAGNMLLKLSSTLGNDIENSIKNTGSEALKDAHEEAKGNYKANYVPFLDKDIYKYLSGKKDPQTIVQDIIKPNPNLDKYRDIEKFQSLLPDEQKGMLGHAYLSKAIDSEGKLDANKLGTLLNTLGKRQFDALFPSKDVQTQLNQYNNLRQMNQEPMNVYYNPKTGTRNGPILGALGIGAVGGHAAGLLSALSHMGIISGAARLANKALTSEGIRESVVNSILKRSANPPKMAHANIDSLLDLS